MTEEKINFRYWVALAGPIIEDFKEYNSFYAEVERTLDAWYGDMGGLVFKTRDFDEAKRVAGEAWDIYSKHFPLEDDPDISEIKISVQPRCEKCNYDGRFSDEFCPRCSESLSFGGDYMLTDLFPEKSEEEMKSVE